MIRCAGIALLLAALLMPMSASAQTERIAGSLDRFFPHWGSYLDTPANERSHFTPAYRIGSDRDVPAEHIRMWYEYGGEVIAFALAPDGRITNPPDRERYEAAPEVWINQPQGGMSLSLVFLATLEPGTSYRQLDTAIALEQANRAMRRAAGVAALFAPRLRTVVFVFDGPAPEAWGVRENGTRRALTVQENRVYFRPDERAQRGVERLEFGRAPIQILLDS